MDIFENCDPLWCDIGANEYTAMFRIEWAIFWWKKNFVLSQGSVSKVFIENIFYRDELLEKFFLMTSY